MDYGKLAADILELVGTKDNVSVVGHCATRLRFNLKDVSKAQTEPLKATKGVLGVVYANGQYQVILGANLNPVYEEMMRLAQFDTFRSDEVIAQDLAIPATAGGKVKWALGKVIDYIAGSMGPVIPALVAAGLIKVILTLGGNLGWDAASSTYNILNTVYNAAFFFLPVFVAYSAARKLNCTPVLAMLVSATLLHSGFTTMVSSGEPITMFGIGVAAVSYSSTILPALLSTLVLSWVEKLCYRYIPKVIRQGVAPLIVMLVMIPLTLWVIGPIGYWIGNLLVKAILLLEPYTWIGVPVLSALLPFLVMTGTHSLLAPTMIGALADPGYDVFGRPAFFAYNFAASGAAFCVGIKTKDKDLRSDAIASTVNGLVAGVTEPALYGICLQLKTPLIATCIGSFAGGLYAGIMGVRSFAMAGASVLTYVIFGETIVNGIIASMIAFAVAFAATWVIGFREPKKA